MTHPLQRARVRVPGSTSNLGSGYDTIGLAVDRFLDVTYEPAGEGGLHVTRAGTLAGLSRDEPDLVARTFSEVVERAGLEAHGRLVLDSTIPVARGLGASAAAVIAGLDLARAALGEESDLEGTLRDAFKYEGHGDNAAPSLHGGLVSVVRTADGPVLVRLRLSEEVGFAYAAPASPISTRAAREALPKQVPHRVAAASLGRLTALLRGLAEAHPQLLRIGIEDELHTPYRIGMIPSAAAAMSAAYEAGAWAVTISGAGSGLIAMCDPGQAEQIATAMHEVFDAGAGDPDCVGFAVHPCFEGASRVEI